MGYLWRLMVRLFGHRWSSSYGESDEGNVWRAALRGVTRDQLSKGFRALVSSGAEWPPTAPQFRAMCGAVRAENAPMYRPVQHQLEKLRDPEKQRDGLRAAMAVLGKTCHFDREEAATTPTAEKGE